MAKLSVLKVENVSLSFAGVQALTDVSFEAAAGSITAVIGPNGAGKTSLFNCICGAYRPDHGSVTFGGEELVGRSPHAIARHGVARMFQNLAVFEQLTVLDNLMLGRHHLTRSPWYAQVMRTPSAVREEIAHRTKVEEVIEFLQLESYRKMPCGILPYGILKRVELGRALCMEPRLILLDEPAAGLNQEETEEMARLILDIAGELGVTQLLIEHELHMVLDLADEVVVLDFGHKIAAGPPDVVRQHEAVLAAYMGGEL